MKKTTGAEQASLFQQEDEEMFFLCSSPKAMVQIAVALAPVLESGDIILLWGELGAGKTTLAQCLAHAAGIGADQYVASPSFALLHEYNGPLPVFHMDLYRLKDEEDVENAGLDDFSLYPGLILIEWPERLGVLMPRERLDIRLHVLTDQTRRLVLHPHGSSWLQKLKQIDCSFIRMK